MKKKLILYSTTDGQTLKICERIKKMVSSEIDIVSLDNIKSIELDFYDLIILGASIRYGKHKLEVSNFVLNNKEFLESKKTAFFSVNAVARKDNKNTPESNPYILKFLKQTNWKPDYVEVFAGKINYPKYNLIDKYIIRFIMWITKGPTNIKNVYEFTDWAKVDNFASKFSA
jgi:menaquinone-dependent protoporphyrinogen oxidase